VQRISPTGQQLVNVAGVIVVSSAVHVGSDQRDRRTHEGAVAGEAGAEAGAGAGEATGLASVSHFDHCDHTRGADPGPRSHASLPFATTSVDAP
jgi:hypothetical protein